jgi:platelet-activating factor acetylhydrolase
MPLSSIFPESVLGHRKKQIVGVVEPAVRGKKPKARPPDGLRDRIPLYGRLPKYSRSYKVGIIDIEIPTRNPRIFFHTKREHTHLLALDTVLFVICYLAYISIGSGLLPRA